jgi:hypothetical protein
MFTDAQLATAIDCEGYIGINRMMHPSGRIQHSAKIGLAMSHPAIPSALKVRFGGSLRREHNPKGNYDMHRWELVGNKQTGPTLSTLLPFLVVKKAQAENVLAFLTAFVQMPAQTSHRRRTQPEMDLLESFWITGKGLNRPAPTTTERENPVMECDSLTSQETARKSSEAKVSVQ